MATRTSDHDNLRELLKPGEPEDERRVAERINYSDIPCLMNFSCERTRSPADEANAQTQAARVMHGLRYNSQKIETVSWRGKDFDDGYSRRF